MKTSSITLFESPQASFRLTLQTMFEKLKADGTTQSKIFYNQQNESLNANVGTFLCFYYYVPEDFRATQAVFTSTAHIYYIRKAFEEIHQYLLSSDLIIDVNGVKTINPKYADPIVVSEIGKKQDWISLRVFIDERSNSNLCVGIMTSKSNNYTSNLLVKEFLAIYDIIQHLDFATLEYNAVLLELISRNMKTYTPRQTSYNYNNNYNPQYSARRPMPNQNFNMNTGFNNQQPVMPRYQKIATNPVQPDMTKPVTNQEQYSSVPSSVLPPRPATVVSASKPSVSEQTPVTPVKENKPERVSLTQFEKIENIPVEEESLSLTNPDDEEYLNEIFE